MAKKPLHPLTLAPLHQVLSELNIQPDDWDALLVGDGSGTDWKNTCGFSAVLIDHYGNYRAPFHGSLNTGTNQLAELMPYLHAMTWYASGPGKARLEDRLSKWKPNPNHPIHPYSDPERPPGVKIHIITDNKNLANQGNYLAQRKAYSWIWKAFDELTSMGYQFKWHWLPRMKLGLNRFVDCMSGKCRLAMEKIELPPDTSLYDFNPDFVVPDPQVDTPPGTEYNQQPAT